MKRARHLDRQTVLDWTIAGALLIWGQIDLWAIGGVQTTVHGPRASGALYVLCATVPLVFRRRWPLGVLCIVMGAIALDSLVVGKAPQGLEVLLPALIAVYSVAAHANRRRALIGFAVGFVGTVIEASLDPEVVTVGQLVVVEGAFFVGLGGSAWLAGRYVRARRLEAEHSEHRAARIERDHHELARAAVAAERGRIARELHDVIAHSVSLMGVQAGAVERVLERDPDHAREALRSIQATARESVGELRRLLGILRADEEPAALAPQPGLDGLAVLVEESRRTGVPVELTVEGEARALPPGIELSAYRVVQEALTNVRKHAPGASTRVLVAYGRRELELHVRSGAAATANGAAPAPGTGQGIVGMRERASVQRHALEAHPEPGGGFVVRARLPVEVAP
jgi:signal transduction histidine kinase